MEVLRSWLYITKSQNHEILRQRKFEAIASYARTYTVCRNFNLKGQHVSNCKLLKDDMIQILSQAIN